MKMERKLVVLFPVIESSFNMSKTTPRYLIDLGRDDVNEWIKDGKLEAGDGSKDELVSEVDEKFVVRTWTKDESMMHKYQQASGFFPRPTQVLAVSEKL
jgi:hypothetical protein